MRNESILITAGPTREKIDPVRFISNYSTGTFGYEIAKEAKRRGLRVTLISGPTCLKAPAGVKTIAIESAVDMFKAVMKEYAKHKYVIMAAAVSDWRVRFPSQGKIKRRGRGRTLYLVENPDILAEIGRKKDGVVAGFALETEALEKNAAEKLRKKNADIIIANRLSRKKDVFGARAPMDVLMLDRRGEVSVFRRKTKRELAKIILDKVLNFNI